MSTYRAVQVIGSREFSQVERERRIMSGAARFRVVLEVSA